MHLKDSIKLAKIARVSRVYLTSIILSVTTIACSPFAELIPFEQDDLTNRGTQPVPQCSWPELSEGQIDGQDVIYMPTSELHKQVACQETEQANYDIATDNAIAVDEAVAAFNPLIDKAEMHQQNAQNELDRVDDERKRKAMEVLTYQGLLAVVLIAIAL